MIPRATIMPVINNLVISMGGLSRQRQIISASSKLGRLYSTSLAQSSSEPPDTEMPEITEAFKNKRLKSINRSMMLYLEKARAHDEFMAKEIKEFESGKRHLANMMNLDPNEMTQEDIDEAIKYLFPSGLFDKRARPMMKPPNEIYQKKKEAQFSIDGRPHHFLFYTTKPNYYEILHNLSKNLRSCNQHEDEKLKEGITEPAPTDQYNFSGRQWIDCKDLSQLILENVDELSYNYFVRSLECLQNHPYSNLAKSFLDKYTKPMAGQSVTLSLPELQTNEDGRKFVTLVTKKRELIMEVTTIFDGTGKIDVMGHDIIFFTDLTHREAILFPLQVSGLLDKVDIKAKIVRSPQSLGNTQIAVAIRQGVSFAIASYVDEATREMMRMSGLLTMDIRTRERKKFGQEGARRKYTWKKR